MTFDSFPIAWTTETRRLADLVPLSTNPRRLSDQARANLQESLKRFGLADPIIVNRDGTVIGGHQRLKLLAAAGVKKVDVRVPERDLTPDELTELNLRLNKNTGEWDYALLAEHFPEDLLAGVGFTAAERVEIFGAPAEGGSESGDGESTDAKVMVGAYRFTVTCAEYEAWFAEVAAAVGEERPAMAQEARRRLGL